VARSWRGPTALTRGRGELRDKPRRTRTRPTTEPGTRTGARPKPSAADSRYRAGWGTVE